MMMMTMMMTMMMMMIMMIGHCAGSAVFGFRVGSFHTAPSSVRPTVIIKSYRYCHTDDDDDDYHV